MESGSSVGEQAVEILHKETSSTNSSLSLENEWDPWEILPDEYRIEGKIGSGITAEVFRGTWRGTAVAIKQIKLGSKVNTKIVEAFKRELTVMVRCRHPNLVLFMGASTRTAPIRLLSEFCEGGTLFDLVHNRKDVDLSWKQKVKILLDIAKGLNYLHNCRPAIVHRDLKSLNLLLSEKIEDEFDTPIMKIADFGMAKIKANVESTQVMTANAGTYHWMAPEVLGGVAYNERVDIYSFGIVMFEVLCREIPFEDTGLDGMKVAVAVSKGKRPNLDFVPKSCPIDLVALMQACWDQKPERRPPMESVIERLKAIRPLRPQPAGSATTVPGMTPTVSTRP
jgi:serine/threonine protein kinase